MKTKILSLLVLVAIAVVSCQKDEADKPVVKQDVTFGIEHVDPFGLKNDTIYCPEDVDGNMLIPTVAEIEVKDLNDVLIGTFYPELFILGNKLYTQAIKLPPDDYKITKFLLWTQNPVDFPPPVAKIVMATPNSGAAFAEYITPAYLLEYGFTVDAFAKKEIEIEVLCFEPAKYTEFGFFWFQVDEIVIREKCFFGDLCVKDPNEYLGSDYVNQSTGLQIDMPAIFEIRAYKGSVAPENTLPNSPFTNASAAAFWGVGEPVCVSWPDRIRIDNETFIFELWIYVAVGSSFDYVHFHTWTFVDDDLLTEGGADGVIDFVLGNCNYSGTDLQLAPYMNLPEWAKVNISHPGNPGYWNLNITQVNPAGTYDLPTGPMTGWCGDANTTIPAGNNKTMYIYSSLLPATWPASLPASVSVANVNKINWLFNNLVNYGFPISGNTIDPGDITVSDGLIIQDAIWYILHGNGFTQTGGSNTILSSQMANSASSQGNFSPLPGGWAAIVMVPVNALGEPVPYQFQLILTVVDP